MRLRNVKGSQEKILENPYTIQTDGTNGEDYKGLWNKNIFKNDNPIHIEIGMGKGQFIMGLAAENPDINYIGIEKYSSVLVRALDKRESLETDNLMFLRMDAEDIAEYFAPGEVSRIYLNFSDPWPKDRHAKRRLTSSQFLARYDKILAKDGHIQFKTDNRPLFFLLFFFFFSSFPSLPSLPWVCVCVLKKKKQTPPPFYKWSNRL